MTPIRPLNRRTMAAFLYNLMEVEEEADLSDVIKFTSEKVAKIRIRPPKRPCRHDRTILVCQHDRILECEECHATIDPFEFLLDWANGNGMWEYDLKRLKDECKRMGKRIAALKRLERNAKSRCGKHMKLPESWVLESLIESGKMPFE